MNSPFLSESGDVVQTNAEAGLIAGHEYATRIAALEAAVSYLDDGRPYRVKPNGDIEILERLQNMPHWRRGAVSFYEALSFSRFVKRFRNNTTVVFADAFATPAPKFTAVLDYHPGSEEQTAAQWDLFRGTLPLRFTDSWLRWTKANGQQQTQADFAQFLEDNIPDIADPAGATLVEIARTLEATVGVDWKSHYRADNGEHRFTYLETIEGKASTNSGTVTIPQDLTLVLQPFEGAKRYEVKARFRYRLIGSKVTLWFDLVRLQDVLTEAFNDELLKIEGEINGATPAAGSVVTPVYNGPAPEALTPPSLKD
jgi:uncharacterized protein YfdQ (DUF2303 family)